VGFNSAFKGLIVPSTWRRKSSAPHLLVIHLTVFLSYIKHMDGTDRLFYFMLFINGSSLPVRYATLQVSYSCRSFERITVSIAESFNLTVESKVKTLVSILKSTFEYCRGTQNLHFLRIIILCVSYWAKSITWGRITTPLSGASEMSNSLLKFWAWSGR